MSPAKIAELRSKVCSALADLGGVCERLNELSETALSPAWQAEASEEISDWLIQASDTLREASLFAEHGTL